MAVGQFPLVSWLWSHESVTPFVFGCSSCSSTHCWLALTPSCFCGSVRPYPSCSHPQNHPTIVELLGCSPAHAFGDALIMTYPKVTWSDNISGPNSPHGYIQASKLISCGRWPPSQLLLWCYKTLTPLNVQMCFGSWCFICMVCLHIYRAYVYTHHKQWHSRMHIDYTSFCAQSKNTCANKTSGIMWI